MQQQKNRSRVDATPHVVILCGGAGVRLWPMSRKGVTKPFLKLPFDRSLIAQTFDRALRLVPSERIFVVTTRDLALATKKALPKLRAKNLIVEPKGKNTAAACMLAAQTLEQRAKGPVNLLVLPADHYISSEAAFTRAVRKGLARAAEGESLVTFGLSIRAPKTEFGYIESKGLSGRWGEKKAVRFIEKPSLSTAKRFMRSQKYFWNSGMFAWRTDLFMKEMRAHAPKIAEPLESKEARAKVYSKIPNLSIDYALMEKSKSVDVIPSDFPWSDLGTWAALWEALAKSPADDVVLAKTFTQLQSRGNLVHAKGLEVAFLGVDNLVVVAHENRLLVTTREKSRDLKSLVETLPSV